MALSVPHSETSFGRAYASGFPAEEFSYMLLLDQHLVALKNGARRPRLLQQQHFLSQRASYIRVRSPHILGHMYVSYPILSLLNAY